MRGNKAIPHLFQKILYMKLLTDSKQGLPWESLLQCQVLHTYSFGFCVNHRLLQLHILQSYQCTCREGDVGVGGPQGGGPQWTQQ